MQNVFVACFAIIVSLVQWTSNIESTQHCPYLLIRSPLFSLRRSILRFVASSVYRTSALNDLIIQGDEFINVVVWLIVSLEAYSITHSIIRLLCGMSPIEDSLTVPDHCYDSSIHWIPSVSILVCASVRSLHIDLVQDQPNAAGKPSLAPVRVYPADQMVSIETVSPSTVSTIRWLARSPRLAYYPTCVRLSTTET